MAFSLAEALARLAQGKIAAEDRQRQQQQQDTLAARVAALDDLNRQNITSEIQNRTDTASRQQQQADAAAAELERKNTQRQQIIQNRVGFLTTKKGLDPIEAQSLAEDDNAFNTFIKPPVQAPQKRTAAAFVSGGNHIQGSVDEQGNYYDAAGNRITNAMAYEPPKTPGIKTWQGPNGQIVNLPEGTPPPQGYVPYSASSGGSSGQSAQTSVADLISKDKTMSQLEPTIIQNKALTPWAELQGGASYGAQVDAAHGKTGLLPAVTQFIGQTAGQHLGKTNPDAQRYFELGTNFGDEASNAFKGRTNEASAARKIALSRLSASNLTNPGVAADTQEKRRNVIGMAILTHPEQHGALSQEDIAYYTGSLTPQERAEAAAAAGQSAPQAPASGYTTVTANGKTFRIKVP